MPSSEDVEGGRRAAGDRRPDQRDRVGGRGHRGVELHVVGSVGVHEVEVRDREVDRSAETIGPLTLSVLRDRQRAAHADEVLADRVERARGPRPRQAAATTAYRAEGA
jgi:hypothetical protein